LPFEKCYFAYKYVIPNEQQSFGIGQNDPILFTITNVVISNPAHGEMYSIQHYILLYITAGRWFSPGTPVSSTNKTDGHDIT